MISWLTVCKSTDSLEYLRKGVAAGDSHPFREVVSCTSSSADGDGGGDGGDGGGVGDGGGDGGGVSASGLNSSSNGLSLSNPSIW